MLTRKAVGSLFVLVVVCGVSVAAKGTAAVEVTPVEPAVLAEPITAASVIVADTDIFKRTPVVDGVIEPGEWDAFYSTCSGDWEVTTFADWDSANLYLGAKSNRPIDFLGVLDANDDGWFHGEENYEFRAVRSPDGGLGLTVSRYESRNTKSPAALPVSAGEAALVEMKSMTSAEGCVVELGMPMSLVRGFKPAHGTKIGLNLIVRTGTGEGDWIPTTQLGDVKECTLVTRKYATLKPLTVGFDLTNSAVARGEKLYGRFHLTNTSTESLDVRSFVVAGEGRAGGYLSSEKIRIEGLPPGKHMRHDTETLIPTDMPLGSWALGAEVISSNSTKLGAALVSFDVVDPFDIEMRLPKTDVRADVKDVTFGVAVKNNMRRSIRGRVKITVPIGWELWKNADARDFTVGARGGVKAVMFRAKPPLGEMGEVLIKADVTVDKETKTVEGKFNVVTR